MVPRAADAHGNLKPQGMLFPQELSTWTYMRVRILTQFRALCVWGGSYEINLKAIADLIPVSLVRNDATEEKNHWKS